MLTWGPLSLSGLVLRSSRRSSYIAQYHTIVSLYHRIIISSPFPAETHVTATTAPQSQGTQRPYVHSALTPAIVDTALTIPSLARTCALGHLYSSKKKDAHVNMSPRLSRSGVCKKKKHPDDPIPRLQKKKKGNHVSCINAPKDRDERYVHTNAWYDRILGHGRRHRSDIPSDRGVRWDQGRHASATGLSYRPQGHV